MAFGRHRAGRQTHIGNHIINENANIEGIRYAIKK